LAEKDRSVVLAQLLWRGGAVPGADLRPAVAHQLWPV